MLRVGSSSRMQVWGLWTGEGALHVSLGYFRYPRGTPVRSAPLQMGLNPGQAFLLSRLGEGAPGWVVATWGPLQVAPGPGLEVGQRWGGGDDVRGASASPH